jgi:hypothetical protein
MSYEIKKEIGELNFYDYGDSIKWDSEPIYDYWWWQFDKPSKYWTASDWVIYHKRLVEHFGLEVANEKWKAAIQKMDFFEHGTSWFKYNQDFVNYFETQGIDIGHFLSKAYVTTNNVIDDVLDFTESVSNAFKWLIPAVAVIIIVAMILYFYNQKKNEN